MKALKREGFIFCGFCLAFPSDDAADALATHRPFQGLGIPQSTHIVQFAQNLGRGIRFPDKHDSGMTRWPPYLPSPYTWNK